MLSVVTTAAELKFADFVRLPGRRKRLRTVSYILLGLGAILSATQPLYMMTGEVQGLVASWAIFSALFFAINFCKTAVIAWQQRKWIEVVGALASNFGGMALYGYSCYTMFRFGYEISSLDYWSGSLALAGCIAIIWRKQTLGIALSDPLFLGWLASIFKCSAPVVLGFAALFASNQPDIYPAYLLSGMMAIPGRWLQYACYVPTDDRKARQRRALLESETANFGGWSFLFVTVSGLTLSAAF